MSPVSSGIVRHIFCLLTSGAARESFLGMAGSQDVLAKVLTNASGAPMTVAEATLIADNALEHSVRCVLAALAAPEILKSHKGRSWLSGISQCNQATRVPDE